MAGEDRLEPASFVARVSGAFHRTVFQPMFQKAPASPSDVRQLIAEFRRQLDLLDAVIATAEQGGGNAAVVDSARLTALASGADMKGGAAETDEFDDIGRNQRSRLRELHLLDAMARETRPYSLQQLLFAVSQKGFDDSSAAVVSQLHRLKKLELIHQPASGMYEITTGGLGHLRKLRASIGALVGDPR